MQPFRVCELTVKQSWSLDGDLLLYNKDGSIRSNKASLNVTDCWSLLQTMF